MGMVASNMENDDIQKSKNMQLENLKRPKF
jgi:hypothetical protein